MRKMSPACKFCAAGAVPVFQSTVSPAKKQREELHKYSLNEEMRLLVWTARGWWHHL